VIGLVPQPESLVLPRSIGCPKRSLAELADTLIMDPRQLDFFWRLMSCAAEQSERGGYSERLVHRPVKSGDTPLRG
jgi:hypothetical protein